ncbi:unnamed protein product [Diabrotica balteata]|uniref:Uncharacterized protein n=1 Tax=Diabrotica balteata TaxID=107213 RepID=A0A9N9X9L0_DIABA|nr:unnamed protein product [Diabrotica balteata]
MVATSQVIALVSLGTVAVFQDIAVDIHLNTAADLMDMVAMYLDTVADPMDTVVIYPVTAADPMDTVAMFLDTMVT